MKRIHYKEKQEQQTLRARGAFHHMLETLIDETFSRTIITPPNKVTYSNTNNLVLPQLLSNFSRLFFFGPKSFSN
jgi:hypothetical protein